MPLTKEEKAWAELQLASFLIHQSRKTLSSFWPTLRASFLSQFPLTGLTVDSQPALVEELKFQSLKNCFNNQNTRTRKRGTPSLEPATSGVTRTRRSGRAHTKREIYSRMYYNTECKQNVNSEISGCGPGVTKGERMSIRNKHIDLGWEAARGNPEKMAKINTVLEAEKAKKQECESSLVKSLNSILKSVSVEFSGRGLLLNLSQQASNDASLLPIAVVLCTSENTCSR